MSAYLMSEDAINALATYAAGNGLVEDATLFADLLTLQNVRSMQARYPGRPWLMADVIEPAMAYRYKSEERDAADIRDLAEEYDYQACETSDYAQSLCKRLIDRIIAHAGAVS